MKYSSKFKSPRKPPKQQANNEQPEAPPPVQPPNLQSSRISSKDKKEKKSISYFQKQQSMLIKEGKGGQHGKMGSTRMEKMSHLLGNIMNKHMEMKRKLQNLKNQQRNKENASLIEYTFEPKLTLNPRYPIYSRMEERNKSWDEARAQHFTSIRQEVIEKEIKECTFSPKFVSKPKSQRYLKDREFKTDNMRGDRENEEINKLENKFIKMRQRALNTDFEPQRNKPTIDIASIKGMIKTEISRITFNF